MGLVFGVEFAAERRLRKVEGADEIVRLTLAQIKQIADESEDGVGGQAGRAGHGGDGVEDLKDERVRIHQIHHARSIAGGHDGTRIRGKERDVKQTEG